MHFVLTEKLCSYYLPGITGFLTAKPKHRLSRVVFLLTALFKMN